MKKKKNEISGSKLLKLSKSPNQLFLLEKMLLELLKNIPTQFSKTWKVKTTPQGYLIFQLQVSEQNTKDKEYSSLHIKMYPTPRASDIEGGIVKNVQIHNGRFYRVNKEGVRWGVKLRDAVYHLNKTGGKINPQFWEALMGFPKDWTKI